jgi:PAS domain S-box-containing protein
MDLVEDMVLVIHDDAVTFVNQSLLDAVHRRRDQVVGKPISKASLGELGPVIKDLMASMESEGERTEGNIDVNEGILGQRTVSARLWRSEDRSYLVLSRAVPEREGNRKDRLMELEDKLSAMLSLTASSGIGLCVVERTDTEVRLKSVNEHLQAIVDRSEEELIGHNPLEFVDDKDVERVKGQLMKIWELGQTPSPVQVPLKDGLGEVAHMQFSAALLSPPNDNMALCLVQDLTTIQMALDQQNKMVQAIERIDETVVLADMKGHIFYANPTALRSSGYTFEEVVGKPVSMFHAPESVGPIAGPELMEFMRVGSWRGDEMACTKEGKRYPVEIIASLVKDEAGNPNMIVVVSRRIEERLKREAQLTLDTRQAEYITEILRSDIIPTLERSVEALSGEAADATSSPDENVASDLRRILGISSRLIDLDPSLTTAQSLAPLPIVRLLQSRIDELEQRYAQVGLSMTIEAEDDNIEIMANELLLVLLNRLLRVVLATIQQPPVELTIKVRQIPSTPEVRSVDGLGKEAEEPSIAEISFLIPGFTLPEELKGVFSRREIPRRSKEEGEVRRAMETANLQGPDIPRGPRFQEPQEGVPHRDAPPTGRSPSRPSLGAHGAG